MYFGQWGTSVENVALWGWALASPPRAVDLRPGTKRLARKFAGRDEEQDSSLLRL